MTIFVESPWPATMLCIVLEVILSIIFMRTGRGLVVVAMGVVLAITAAMLVLERTIVTDTEEVEDTLDGIAEALEANDAAAVLAAISPACPKLAQARSALDDVTIRSASVGADLEVRISKLTNPPTATAYFTGRIEGKDNRGTIPYEHFVRKFKVKLEKRGDRWLVTDYDQADPGRPR
ncbi:MAG: hypothetical protein WD063_13960 [Pirellulales bacterium]